jgi:hypothetical protein
MAKIEIRTYIDITKTNVNRLDQGTEKQLNQQRNYTTFLQVLGLRSIFSIIQEPKEKDGEWTFCIDTDRESVYNLDNEPLGLLIQDLDMVPIVTGLDEVKANKNKIIKLTKPQPNTFVKVIE